MSKKHNGQANQESGKNMGKGPALHDANKGPGKVPGPPDAGKGKGKTASFSHGPVGAFDMERAKKELEKNHIEFKVENGELCTVDHGDAGVRNTAIKLLGGLKRKVG